MTCNICNGSRSINLPITQRLRLSIEGQPKFEKPEKTYKTYACPECCASVAEERVLTVGATATIRDVYDCDDYRHAIKQTIAQTLARALLDKECITFEETPRTDNDFKTEITGTIGVVSASYVANLQARANAAARPLLEQAATLAIENIRQWGSAYGHIRVDKDHAAREINAAIDKVLNTGKTGQG